MYTGLYYPLLYGLLYHIIGIPTKTASTMESNTVFFHGSNGFPQGFGVKIPKYLWSFTTEKHRLEGQEGQCGKFWVTFLGGKVGDFFAVAKDHSPLTMKKTPFLPSWMSEKKEDFSRSKPLKLIKFGLYFAST